jgi:ribosomal protein S18 acetylase RimI-like enzyme
MTTTSTLSPIALREDQIDAAGRMEARAFDDDPLMCYFEPDDERRRRWLPWFFGAAVRMGHLYGTVHTTEDVAGAAVWLADGQTGMHPMRMVRSGMLAMPFKLGFGALGRTMGLMNTLEKLHKEAVPPDHWYLALLGVEPARQGQGVGGALLQPVLAQADAQHWPCYLETQKERNVPFYQRHGFEVVVEIEPKSDGRPKMWTMRREART